MFFCVASCETPMFQSNLRKYSIIQTGPAQQKLKYVELFGTKVGVKKTEHFHIR